MDPRPRVRVPRRRRRRRGEKKTRRDAAPRAPRRLQQRRGERARGREGDARGTVDVESVAQRGRARRGGGGVSVFVFFAPPRLRLRRDAGVLATVDYNYAYRSRRFSPLRSVTMVCCTSGTRWSAWRACGQRSKYPTRDRTRRTSTAPSRLSPARSPSSVSSDAPTPLADDPVARRSARSAPRGRAGDDPRTSGTRWSAWRASGH